MKFQNCHPGAGPGRSGVKEHKQVDSERCLHLAGTIVVLSPGAGIYFSSHA